MTDEPAGEVRVFDNDRKRFEAYVGQDLAGVMEYIPLSGKIIATHTETFEAYEGRGVGAKLVAGDRR